VDRLKSHNTLGRRHFLIPDTQDKPGAPQDHLAWVGQAIVDYAPDVVVHIGDHFDMPSLNKHVEKGSAALEGARYEADILHGRKGFDMLSAPTNREVKRQSRNKKGWKPARKQLLGNHEDRISRTVSANPVLDGPLDVRHCFAPGWEHYDYLERVWVDGIIYSHFFQNQHSSHAIGGSIDNRLNKISESFVQGHQQGFIYGNRVYPTGRMKHGLVAGSCYLHREDYKGNQGNNHFRGVVVLNEVVDGDYCVMPLTLKYLCRRYEGIDLVDYMNKKYPKQNWGHLRT
jgi:hypothetical protein